MARKYTISMAVDGRIDVHVEAENVKEALEKANSAFMDVDLANMETEGAKPASVFDEELQDYVAFD